MDNTIGLHVYAITQHRARNPQKIPFSDSGDGARLKNTVPHFVKEYEHAESNDGGPARPWYLAQGAVNGKTYEGNIMYGSTGYATDIVDRKTRATQYQRKTSDIEIFPLYYRLWIPNSGSYALLGLQTFGQRSCVGRFQSALESVFRNTNYDYRITYNPVAPGEIASYKSAEVKTINLTKRDYSSDAAENQLGEPGALVDLSVSFSAKRRSNLGPLKNFLDKVKTAKAGNVLDYNATHFDEATAEIMVGGKRRTVTLIGISKNTGKFDLTNQVQRGPNGMPTFQSISLETGSIFNDIATG